MKTLSVIIPVYNEQHTIRQVLDAVERHPLPGVRYEVIVVDDGSTDGTRDTLRALEAEKPATYRIFFREHNRGKGAAVRFGLLEATGDFAIIQDADLEYNPAEYDIVIGPLLTDEADVVFSSRFMSGKPHRVLFFWHYLGNRALTFLSNMFTNLNLSDMESCYKAFNRKALNAIVPKLRANRFGIEPELVARAAHLRVTRGQAKEHLRIYEVGISYFGRTYEEGKKITWRDGLAALWAIIRYNLFS